MQSQSHYQADIDFILSHRFDQGADFWTTPDKRLIKGSPFSMMECICYLIDLGVDPKESLIRECVDLIFSTQRDDGRFQLQAKGAIYPCHTAYAARVLAWMGYAADSRLTKTYKHLLEIQYGDGGWRCSKFSFGRGPETEHSNPHPTLTALDAFRFTAYRDTEPALDRAVDFLLSHWEIRIPIGPCHYGMGTLFFQARYPFREYNLFYYVYVLSFYRKARDDKRFLEALRHLEGKLVDGRIVVERVVPKMRKLSFCKQGEPSELATRQYHQILENMRQT